MNSLLLGILAGIAISSLFRILLSSDEPGKIYRNAQEQGISKEEAFRMAKVWEAFLGARKAGLSLAEFKRTAMKLHEGLTETTQEDEG